MKIWMACFMFAFAVLCGAALQEAAGARTLEEPAEIPLLPRSPPADTLVLVTIDGVRWQEVFLGVDPKRASEAEVVGASELLPNLRSFFDEGAVLGDPRIGSRMAASGPRYVSLPGYVEMLTGGRGGCADNDCIPQSTWTIPEEISRRAGGSSVAVFSSWDRIAAALPQSGMVVRAGRAPKDAADPSPGCGAYRPDRSTTAEALSYLLQNRPRFLWVALGDTDEWAHRNDYAAYLRSLRLADAFVGELSATVAAMGNGDRTAIFITTDHGRDEDFANHGGAASADVWLMARGAGIQRRGSVATMEPRYLRDIAPTMAALIGSEVAPCAGCGRVIRELL